MLEAAEYPNELGFVQVGIVLSEDWQVLAKFLGVEQTLALNLRYEADKLLHRDVEELAYPPHLPRFWKLFHQEDVHEMSDHLHVPKQTTRCHHERLNNETCERRMFAMKASSNGKHCIHRPTEISAQQVRFWGAKGDHSDCI
jgi:hypothetical protein